MSSVELSMTIESFVSELSLLTQTLSGSQSEHAQGVQIQEKINKKIDAITLIISSHINYYREVFMSERTPFLLFIKRFIKLFEQLLTPHGVKIVDKIEITNALECHPYKMQHFLSRLFLILLKVLRTDHKAKEMSLTFYYEKEDGSDIRVSIEGFLLEAALKDEIQNGLHELLEQSRVAGLDSFILSDIEGNTLCI